MNTFSARGYLVLLSAWALASCGGGSSSANIVTNAPTSIALSPLTVSLAPAGTQQLTVTGTFSDGTTKTLAAGGESFKSSNTNVASVSSAGLVTVAANAAIGDTATISVTDTTSGVVSATAASTVVTVVADVGPTANSGSAATATAKNNAQCAPPDIDTAYYWEIGDVSGTLVSGTHADAAGATLDEKGNPISADTSVWAIASGSKWIYSTYVIEVRGSANILNNTDPSIPYLNFTSGYTYLGNFPPTTNCPSLGSVDDCLAGLPTTPNPATTGHFYYDSGHMEEHATKFMGLGGAGILDLKNAVQAALGSDIKLVYSIPLLAAGIDTTASDYALFLRRILSGQYKMSATLSANPVCTNSTVSGCAATAGQSPIANASSNTEAWHYSMGHWIEDDPVVGDGAFSSPGALGFYPWIDKNKTYYGIIARANTNVTGQEFEGYKSAVCGRLIRRAWETGIEQTGAAPVL